MASEFGRVEKLWSESTVVILGSGPSLTRADVEFCQGRAKVIAVKHTISYAPWADCLYGAGADASRWWSSAGPNLTAYTGLRYTLDPRAAQWATVLKNTGESGFDPDPSCLRTGRNSGYQAICVAVHLGARRIVLLGFDMSTARGHHWFGEHQHGIPPPVAAFIPFFDSLVAPLVERNIDVVNASRETELRTFPRVALEDALALVPA
jgi:hypothetical protein